MSGFLGVQRRPFVAFLRALLLMDLRGQQFAAATGAGAHEQIPPLFWVIGQYLVVSLLFSLLLFARVDAGFFAFANLSCAAVLVMSAIISEFNEVLFDPLDLEVMAHRPVSAVTYAAARTVNLAVYLGCISVAVTIFPLTIGAGQRDAGWGFAPAYLVASVLVCTVTAGVAIAAYAWRGSRDALERIKIGFAWIQIVAIMLLFYGGQAMLRNGSASVSYVATFPPQWFAWIPTHIAGAWVADVSRDLSSEHLMTLAAMVGVAVLTSALALRKLSALYAHASRHSAPRAIIIRSRGRQGTVLGGILALFLSSRQAAAGAWLSGALLRRDTDLQMRSWTAMSVPAGAALLGVLTGMLGDPMRDAGMVSLATFGVVALLASAIPPVLFNLQFSRDFEASWLLRGAPIANESAIADGARRQTLITVFLPFMLLYFAILTWIWRHGGHALAQFAGCWLTLEICAWVAAPLSIRGVLFSRPPVTGASIGWITLIGALVGSAAMALLVIQQQISGSVPWLVLYLAVLAAVRLTLASSLGRRLRRLLAGRERR